MPGFRKGGAVELHLARDFVDRLAKQVGQHVGPRLSGLTPGVRVACGGDPGRNFAGDRARLGLHGEGGAVLAGELHRFAAPQAADLVQRVEKRLAVGGGRVLGSQDKVVGLPAGGEGHAGAAVGQVVDDRPFLGDAGRMVERRDDAARADADRLRDGGGGGPGDRGVGVGAAEGMEVAFRRPDGDEPVLIGKLGAFQEEFVFRRAGQVIVPPVVDRELHLPGGDAAADDGPGRGLHPGRIVGKHDGEAVGQRPEQLQHRDIEAEGGDGQPGACIGAQNVVHAREEVHRIAVADDHALGTTGGARGVDHIGRVFGRGALGQGGGHIKRIGVQDQVARPLRQVARDGALGDDHRTARILGIKRQPVGGVGRVHRHIGRARKLDAKRACDHVGRAAAGKADKRPLADAHAAQGVGDACRAGGKFGEGKLRRASDHGGGIRGLRGLGQDRGGNCPRPVIVARRRGKGTGIDPGFGVGERRKAGKVGFGIGRHPGKKASDAGGKARGFGRRHPRRVMPERPAGQGDGGSGQGRGRVADRKARWRDGGHAGLTQREVGGDPGGGARGGKGLGSAGLRGGHAAKGAKAHRHPGQDIARRGVLAGGEGDVARRSAQGAQGSKGKTPRIGGGKRDFLPLLWAGGSGQRRVGLQKQGAKAGFRLGHRRKGGIERCGVVRRERGKRCPGARGVDGQALEAGELRQPHCAAGAGHVDKICATAKHRAGQRGAGDAFGRSDCPDLALRLDLGNGKGIAIAAMIQRMHDPDDGVGVLREIKPTCRSGPIRPAPDPARPGGLRLARMATGLHRGDDVGKAFHRRGKAARVEREGGIVRLDRKGAGCQNLALVDPGGDEVPGDRVGLFPVQKRPDRRVQTRVAGKRAVMEIDTTLPRPLHHRFGHEGQVCDRQHPVDHKAGRTLDQSGPWRDDLKPGLGGPGGDPWLTRDDGGKGVTPLQPAFAAFDRQAFVADQEGSQGHGVFSGHSAASL